MRAIILFILIISPFLLSAFGGELMKSDSKVTQIIGLIIVVMVIIFLYVFEKKDE